MFPATSGQQFETVAILLVDGAGGLDFDSPGLLTPGDDQVNFISFLIPIMPETKIRVGPFRLGHELLDDEGLEKMPHPLPLFKPICRAIIG